MRGKRIIILVKGGRYGGGSAANTFLDLSIVLGGADVEIIDRVRPVARSDPKVSG